MVILLHTNRLQEGVFCRAILHALLALGDKLPCYKTAKQGFAKYPQENTILCLPSGISSKQAHSRAVDVSGLDEISPKIWLIEWQQLLFLFPYSLKHKNPHISIFIVTNLVHTKLGQITESSISEPGGGCANSSISWNIIYHLITQSPVCCGLCRCQKQARKPWSYACTNPAHRPTQRITLFLVTYLSILAFLGVFTLWTIEPMLLYEINNLKWNYCDLHHRHRPNETSPHNVP